MGSVPSTPSREGSDDPWWPIENQNLELNPFAMDPSELNTSQNESRPVEAVEVTDNSENKSDLNENSDENESRNTSESDKASHSSVNCDKSNLVERINKREQSLEEFKEELRVKRELRKCAIAELRNEVTSLRQQLAEQKEINQRLIDDKGDCHHVFNNVEAIDDIDSGTRAIRPNIALQTQLADVQMSLQSANSEILLLTSELTASRKQVQTLKDVIKASKDMISIREVEVEQLKIKLKQIEESLAEREMHLMSENLRQEYDRQLVNIRNLRALYEERARISAAEKENLNRQLETSRAEHQAEIVKNKNLEEHIASLDTDLKNTSVDLFATREQLSYYKAENSGLHEEMTVINQLFSQLLAGFSGNNDIDIDKLSHMLEENRDLLNDMTNRECSKEGAAQLPKLLFDLVSQANKSEDAAEIVENIVPSTSDAEEASKTKKEVTSAQEIIRNLPKVWKVLIELLSHQQLKPVQIKENNQSEDCYKSVETPNGPQLVLSVSKTYIKLKDLILEKKFLQKETNKLKNLNSHLESRLGEQEKRLSTVTIELNKTWNLVGRMQRQHRQLHTHEQVLRYQLQQKRRMLSELKDELEYCRRKWALAKEKNNESQSQWESLRLEFSKRKEMDANNSAESGYSDGPASEDDDDDDENSIDESSINVSESRKAIKEKFLLNIDQNSQKALRIHSVSPVRSARLNVSRRNSDSLVQFATEVFQMQSDVVQPIVDMHCAECNGICVKQSVHFDASAIQQAQDNEKLKITEPIVRNANEKKTHAQKLIETKASCSKVKVACHLRKKPASPQPSTSSKAEESLEDMFMRLSGSEPVTSNASKNEDEKTLEIELEVDSEPNCDDSLDEATFLSSDDERRILRAARIQRLEEQCKSLLQQVARANDRGDSLTRQIDDIQKRYTPDRESRSKSIEKQQTNQVEASTSGAIGSNGVKTDEECLTNAERAYTSRRDERLKRLEAESQAFLNKVKSTNSRATVVDNKLEFLHGRYGNATEAATSNISASAEISIDNEQSEATQSTSGATVSHSTKTDEECLTDAERSYTSRRDERLKRLEAESQAFLNKIKSRSQLMQRATAVNKRLEFLRGRYGSDTETSSESIDSSGSLEMSSNSEPTDDRQANSTKTDEKCLTDASSRQDERLKRLQAESQAFLDKIKERNRRFEQSKIVEPVVRRPIDKKTNAQKLIESKASTSKVEVACHLRKLKPTSPEPPSPSNKVDESLEDMFLRLSGQPATDEPKEAESTENADGEKSEQTETDQSIADSVNDENSLSAEENQQ